MIIHFATCERHTAREYLARFRGRNVKDTPEDAGPILDLVESDLIRIPDPSMHPAGGVVPGRNWDEARRPEIVDAFARWMKQ